MGPANVHSSLECLTVKDLPQVIAFLESTKPFKGIITTIWSAMVNYPQTTGLEIES